MTSYKKIRELIRVELAEQAPELCKSITAEHMGKVVDWTDVEAISLQYAKNNIDAYDEVSWEKQDTERELDRSNRTIDHETGYAVGQYGVLCDMLTEYSEWLEEFNNIHSQEFDHMIERLMEALYPEED